METLDDDVVNQIVLDNIGLAILIASRYRSYCNAGFNFEDLKQEAVIGLHTAARRFDSSRGTKFSTHAFWWIRHAVLGALSEQARTIRLPTYVGENLNRLGRIRSRLTQSLGREPTLDEIAEAAAVPVEQVQAILWRTKRAISFESPFGADGFDTIGNHISSRDGAPAEAAITSETLSQLEDALQSLTAREQAVLRMRFGLDDEPQTLEQIGECMHLTRERIRQIEQAALLKVRSGWDKRPAQPAEAVLVG